MRPNSKNVKVGTKIRLKNPSDFIFKVETVPTNDQEDFTVTRFENSFGIKEGVLVVPFEDNGWDDYEVIVEIEGFEV